MAPLKEAGRPHWKNIGCICSEWSRRHFWRLPGIVGIFHSLCDWRLQERSGVSCLTHRGYHRELSSSLLQCSQGGNKDLILFLDLTGRESKMERCKRDRDRKLIKFKVSIIGHFSTSCLSQRLLNLKLPQTRLDSNSPLMLTVKKKNSSLPESDVQASYAVLGLSHNTGSCECTGYSRFRRVESSQSC